MSLALVLVEAEEGDFGDRVFSGLGIDGIKRDIASVYDEEARTAIHKDDVEYFGELRDSLFRMLDGSAMMSEDKVRFVGYEILKPIEPHWHEWMLIAVRIEEKP